MNTPNQPLTPLSPLEVSGALCSRVVHDLSNLLSGIIGNAEYAQRPETDAASLQKTLQAISVSANSAGKLLGQCLPLQQTVARSVFPFETVEQAALIAESAGLAPGWRVTVSPKLTGNIAVQPRWLAAAVMQIARETDTTMGEIEFACGPAVYPVVWSGPSANPGQPVELFQINLTYRGAQPLFPLPGEMAAEKFPLLAANELIRRFKGQIHARPKPPGRQEITIMLPLV
jgi:hypothetical protein